MASLVVEKMEGKEHEQHQVVDGLFALGINVRCVDLSWTYEKVIITSSNHFPTQPHPSSSVGIVIKKYINTGIVLNSSTSSSQQMFSMLFTRYLYTVFC